MNEEDYYILEDEDYVISDYEPEDLSWIED